MSSHFSPKSLLFYGTMIGSVAILFRVVSGYGEANLKAPPTSVVTISASSHCQGVQSLLD